MRRVLLLAFVLSASACARAPTPPPYVLDAPSFGTASPSAVDLDARPLVDLAGYVRDHPQLPLFSLLISRHGRLAFELYTGGVDRDAAHYLMSVTKSITSTLVGIAVDRGLINGVGVSIADLVPEARFPSPDDRERFRPITLEQLMGMSAIGATDPPRDRSPEALARHQAFLAAPDRLRFALGLPLVTEPGKTFNYNDFGPVIAAAIVANATKQRPLDFARESLFQPLDVQNEEWMHGDPSGDENGAYGLRLRPIDMQKIGLLYLAGGKWNGRRVLSEAWVTRAFTPWITSRHGGDKPNYGTYWWARNYGPGWSAHEANGWRGQRIIVLPEQAIVITMTGDFPESEDVFVTRFVEDFIEPAATHGRSPDAAAERDLARVLAEVHAGAPRWNAQTEPRMIPSISVVGTTPK